MLGVFRPRHRVISFLSTYQLCPRAAGQGGHGGLHRKVGLPMQDQVIGSRRMSAAEPSQESMEQAILSVLLAEGSQPVWTRDELEAQFQTAPIVFADAFRELQSAGVLVLSSEMVKLAHAVRHVSDLGEI